MTPKILSLEEIKQFEKHVGQALVGITGEELQSLLATARAYHELHKSVVDAVEKEVSMDNELQKLRPIPRKTP